MKALALAVALVLVFVLAALPPPAAAAPAPAADVPPAPLYRTLPLPDEGELRPTANGTLEWIGAEPVSGTPGSKTDCWEWGLVQRAWNPATGATSQRPLLLPGIVTRQLVAGRNTWFLSTTSCKREQTYRAGLQTPEGVLTLDTPAPLTYRSPRLVALTDDAVLAIELDATSRYPRSRVLRRQGRAIVAEPMPDLATPYRNDFAIVALDDHRVMLIGGSDSTYRGCSPCRATTQVLDTRERRWTAGPSMREARSEAVAFRLPDGSVLVAGGWTEADFWGPGPSATAERWDPARNAFEPLPPMPVPTALAHARWWPGREGRTLLLVEGMSAGVAAFDVATRTWFEAGAWRAGSEEGACAFFPFVKDGRTWAWQRFRSEGHYSSKSCENDDISLAELHLPRERGATASGPVAAELVTGHVGGTTFVAPDGERPALLVGGNIHVGMNGWPVSGAVDGVDAQGRLFALPALRHARRDPAVLRVGEGLLVVGGHNETAYRRESPPLPPEWLDSTARGLQARWRDLPAAAFAADAVVVPGGGGSLIEIAPDGALSRLRVQVKDGAPVFERAPWTRLSRPRHVTEASPVQARELADGRVVVAGGEVQSEKIALLVPEAERTGAGAGAASGAGAGDTYIGIGPWLPERRHEILDPATGRWTTSAPSRRAGGAVAILDDGRVVKAHPAEGDVAFGLEIHDPATKRWSDLPPPPAGFRAADPWRLSVQQGELLMSGALTVPGTDRSLRALWGFDFAARRWELLWHAERAVESGDGRARLVVLSRPGGRTLVVRTEAP